MVQLSSSKESSDEQDSEDDITSSASCPGMFKSTPVSDRGDMDSSSSTSVFTSATDTSKRTAPTLLSVLQQAKPSDLSRKRIIRKYSLLNLYCSIQKLTLYCMSIIEFYGHNFEHNGLFFEQCSKA